MYNSPVKLLVGKSLDINGMTDKDNFSNKMVCRQYFVNIL